MKRVHSFFTRMTTRTMVLVLYALAVLCLSGLGPSQRLGGFAQLFVFCLGCFIWGAAGIPMIARREAQPFPERGRWAVSLGILHLGLGWGIGAFLLIYNLVLRPH